MEIRVKYLPDSHIGITTGRRSESANIRPLVVFSNNILYRDQMYLHSPFESWKFCNKFSVMSTAVIVRILKKLVLIWLINFPFAKEVHLTVKLALEGLNEAPWNKIRGVPISPHSTSLLPYQRILDIHHFHGRSQEPVLYGKKPRRHFLRKPWWAKHISRRFQKEPYGLVKTMSEAPRVQRISWRFVKQRKGEVPHVTGSSRLYGKSQFLIE